MNSKWYDSISKKLDWLYRGCGVLAAISIVFIALLILAQIVTRPFGAIVPSANDIAGYFMGASIFLALAYTFRAGGHIRVTMVINNLPPLPAKIAQIFTTLFATIVTGYFSWYMVRMVWQTIQYGEVSQGHLPIPLWIPQSTLAIGIVVLFIAFLEESWRVLSGLPPSYEKKIDSHPSGE